VVRTQAPRWIFDVSCRPGIEVQACDTDVGLVQVDSLRHDEEATVRRAAVFYGAFDERAAHEAGRILAEAGAVVVGDIPPLAFAAARRAGVPSIAFGNFTWDWIYEEYPAFARTAPAVVPAIREAYRSAALALRLPFHGGFAPMAGVVRDIPLVAHRASRDPADTRRALGIADDRPVVLASFGGYGAPLAYDEAARDRQCWVVATARDGARVPPAPNLILMDPADLYSRGITYADVVAAANVVLSKPGYGIVSECVANRTALLYTSRGRFREHEVFVEQMPRYLKVRFLPQADALAGRWTGAVEALLAQAEPPERLPVDGSAVAVDEILRLSGG
jgi:hypothetical protein